MPPSTPDSPDIQTITLETFSALSSGKLIASWVEIDSPTGHFVVGPGHVDTISSIRPDSIVVYQTADGLQGSFTAPGGIALIKNDVVKLIFYASR